MKVWPRPHRSLRFAITDLQDRHGSKFFRRCRMAPRSVVLLRLKLGRSVLLDQCAAVGRVLSERCARRRNSLVALALFSQPKDRCVRSAQNGSILRKVSGTSTPRRANQALDRNTGKSRKKPHAVRLPVDRSDARVRFAGICSHVEWCKSRTMSEQASFNGQNMSGYLWEGHRNWRIRSLLRRKPAKIGKCGQGPPRWDGHPTECFIGRKTRDDVPRLPGHVANRLVCRESLRF